VRQQDKFLSSNRNVRRKVLGGKGVLIIILLAFASTDIMRTESIVVIFALLSIGIVIYFIVDIITQLK